jgi:hypothetical protein
VVGLSVFDAQQAGQTLDLLASLDRAGDARARLPRGLAAAERTRQAVTHELIPLTCNEARHLFVALVHRAEHDLTHRLHWSRWR